MESNSKATLESILKAQKSLVLGWIILSSKKATINKTTFNQEVLTQQLNSLKTELDQVNQGRTNTRRRNCRERPSGFCDYAWFKGIISM